MKDLVYRVKNKTSNIIGDLQNNTIKAFWFIKFRNAGDLVTPFLLRQYGFTPVHQWPPQARFVGCGSLLTYLHEDYDGYILGTGFLRNGPALPLLKAKILAVRGAKTRDRIGASRSTILGDPGLLATKFCKVKPSPKYTLGILPHYIDKSEPWGTKILRRYPKETHLIDIQTNPQKVITEIAQCQYILSSTLHGCIFADALKIPVIWPLIVSRIEEREFKFADYCSAFSKELTPSIITGDESLSEIIAMASNPPHDEVDEVIGNLDSAFLTFQHELLGK